MLILKFIRKVVKILRGGAGTREIFLGFFCGVLIGMIPGVNLTLALAIGLMLVLNANVAIAMLGLAFGKLLCISLSPITFQVGYLVIHNIGLEGVFRALADTPVLALLDAHVYCLVGGLPIGLGVGWGLGKLLEKYITKAREKMVLAGSADKLQKLSGNTLVKLLMRIAFGKQKITTEEVLSKKSPLFRKSGVALVCSVAVIGILLEVVLLDFIVKASVEKQLGVVAGAEVNVEKADLSLATGKLEIKGLQVTDADKPTHNRFQSEVLTIDLSVSDLLRKRLAVDLLASNDVQMDVLRESPGAVYRKVEKGEDDEEEAAVKAGEKTPEDYLAQAKEWKKYLETAKRYLDKAEYGGADAPQPPKKDVAENARALGYLQASARELIAAHPTWLIRKIQIDNLKISDRMSSQKLEATELSSHPGLHGKPVSARLTPMDSDNPLMTLALRFGTPGAVHDLMINARNILLDEAVKLGEDIPLDIQQGKADALVSGVFSREALDLPFTIAVRDLKARAEEGKTVLGLDPAVAKEVFSNLEQLEISGKLVGTLISPRVKVDSEKLMASLKGALVKAGKAALAKQADAQMQKLSGELKKQIDAGVGEELKKAIPKDITEKLGLPGFGTSESTDEESTEGEAKEEVKPLDKLKRLF